MIGKNGFINIVISDILFYKYIKLLDLKYKNRLEV
jgi:hypothetical protein